MKKTKQTECHAHPARPHILYLPMQSDFFLCIACGSFTQKTITPNKSSLYRSEFRLGAHVIASVLTSSGQIVMLQAPFIANTPMCLLYDICIVFSI